MQPIFISALLLVSATFAQAQIVNIPDPNFKYALLHTPCVTTDSTSQTPAFYDVDYNDDGEVQVSEALTVYKMDVHNTSIASLEGIEAFTKIAILTCSANRLSELNINALINLTALDCRDNSLTSLDTHNSYRIRGIACNNNQITTINVQGCHRLSGLNAVNNPISALDLHNTDMSNIDLQGMPLLRAINLANCTSLNGLYCSNMQLTHLNVEGCTRLTELYCNHNQLTDLDLQGCTNLIYLRCNHNQITTLNTENLLNLHRIRCDSNSITTLNVSNSSLLDSLNCAANNLSSLYIKNGSIEAGELFFKYNPALAFICCDAVQHNVVRTKAVAAGRPSTIVHSTGDGACVVSTENQTNDLAIGIQPNPCSDIIHIKSDLTLQKAEVFDILGHSIYTTALQNQSISVAHLPSGIYFIKIYSNEGSAIRKIVKE
jgi:hypothetical protein